MGSHRVGHDWTDLAAADNLWSILKMLDSSRYRMVMIILRKGKKSNEDLILQETYPSIFQIIEFYFFTLIFKIFALYCSIVDYQCCVSVMYIAKWFIIHVSILFQILFLFSLLQNIEFSSLCYTVGPCGLSILNIAVWTCQSQTPNLPFPFPLVTISVFSKSLGLFLRSNFKYW